MLHYLRATAQQQFVTESAIGAVEIVLTLVGLQEECLHDEPSFPFGFVVAAIELLQSLAREETYRAGMAAPIDTVAGWAVRQQG